MAAMKKPKERPPIPPPSAVMRTRLATARFYRDEEEAAYRAFLAATELARDSFQACFQEAGSPRPHTEDSRVFWSWWDEAMA